MRISVSNFSKTTSIHVNFPRMTQGRRFNVYTTVVMSTSDFKSGLMQETS
jgi:hypothetical protein